MKTMKHIMAILFGGALMLNSCNKMDDSYKGFLESGEIVYRAKAKDVIAAPGRNRVKLTWKLTYPTQVVKCEIRNGKEILATLPVEYKDSVKFEYILTGLKEKTYTLSVYSFDKEGNSSIKTDVIVDIFGDRYIASLRADRTITEVLRKVGASSVLVKLSETSNTKLVCTNLSYKSTSGEEKKMEVLPSVNEIVIDDLADESSFRIQDIWLPVKDAIDKFESPAKEYKSTDIPKGSARSITSAYKVTDTSVSATLSPKIGNVVRSVIKYADKEIVVEPAANAVMLEEVPAGATVTIETIVAVGTPVVEYFTPITTFDTTSLMTKIAMTNWAVTDFSSEHAEGPAANTIDGKLDTYWHTNYSPMIPYPHHITVDMQSSNLVKGVAVARRQGNASIAIKMKLEVSENGTDWTSIGEFAPNNTVDGLQIFKLSNPATGRYFKLTGLSSPNSNVFMCISEINIFN